MDNGFLDISTSRVNQILKTVFELLWFSPDGLYVSEIIKYLRDSIPFTDYELEPYPFATYMPRFEAIVRIGTIPFMKASWLEKTKNGRWFITSIGRDACKKYKDSVQFFELSVKIFEEWKLQEQKKVALFGSDPFSNAEECSWGQIKEYVEGLDRKDIRIIVTSLLKALGCHILWTTPSIENERTIDMICCLDSLGLKPPRIYVQIVNSSQTTIVEDLASFAQVLDKDDVGILFNFGECANAVKTYALDTKHPAIQIIDLEKFLDLWVENINKIEQVGYSKLPLRPIHFLSLNRNE